MKNKQTKITKIAHTRNTFEKCASGLPSFSTSDKKKDPQGQASLFAKGARIPAWTGILVLCHRAVRSHWCTVGVLAGTHQCALRCPGRMALGCSLCCARVASSWRAHSTIRNCGVAKKGADGYDMSAPPLEWAEWSVQSSGTNSSALISSLHVPPCDRRCRNPSC